MKNFKEIYKYTFKYKGLAIVVIVCNLLFVIFGLISLVLFIPFLQLIFPKGDPTALQLIRPTYNGGIANFVEFCTDYYQYFMQQMVQRDPKEALLFVCITVFLAFFLKNVFRYGAIWYQSQLRMAVVRDVRTSMFAKAMILPLSFYSDERKGDLMSRMQGDVNEIELGVIAVLELIYREPIAIVLNIAALLYWSPQLTLFSFLLLPLTAFVISRIGKSLKRTAGQEKSELGLLFSKLDEALGGMRIIKAFNAQGTIIESFEKTNLRHQQLTTKAFRKKDLASPLNETLGVLVMIGIVWYGGSMILDNQAAKGFTGTEFIGFILVFSQLMRPIQGITTAVGYLNRCEASQDRINEILNADEKILEPEHPIFDLDVKEHIRYENVSFKYKDEYVLKNVSFDIPVGKVVALVGESGSGKSTLSDLLPRFYDITEGAIKLDNTNIKELDIRTLRGKIGIVSQESILFNGTVFENISFGNPSASKEQVIEAAKIANAHNFILELEDGYDTGIGERGNKLSGGQKQRLSIARAVLKNPEILILDEATSALDTESEKVVQDALNSLMKNRTTMIIAHRLSTVQNADEIIVFSKGEIIERGTHVELIARKETYFRLCSLQGIA